jgi:predicted DNA-binding transcriptional regulator AlpA
MTTDPNPKHLPRILSKADAAAYCGLTEAGFDGWIRTGKLPPAMPGTRRWDKVAVDQAIDRLSGVSRDVLVDPAEQAEREWRARRAARHEQKPSALAAFIEKRDARRAAEAALDAKSVSPFRQRRHKARLAAESTSAAEGKGAQRKPGG